MIDSIKKLFKPIQLSIVLLSFTACVILNAVDVNTATASEDAKSTIVAGELTRNTTVDKVGDKPKLMLAKAPAAAATQLTSVSATPLKNNVVVVVKADGAIKDFKYFALPGNPSRIVYDMYGLKSPFKTEQQIPVNSEMVSSVRYYGHPEKVRMVLETEEEYLHQFTASPADDGLLVYVGKAPNIPAATNLNKAEPVAKADSSANNPARDKIVVSQAAQPATVLKTTNPAWLNRIDFASEEAGRSAVIVGTTQPVEYKMTEISGKRIRLELLDTKLPEYRNRALITTRFQSAVDRITPTQEPKAKDTVIFIELREAVPYNIQQTDKIIKVDFSASSIPPKPYEDGQLPAWKDVVAEPASGIVAKSEKEAGKTKVVAEARQEGKLAASELKMAKEELSMQDRMAGLQPAKRFTGEKIALDFYDTDIKNVFRIIREISGKNFAIDKNVTGKVTLTLEKPVPWDQVLDLVLRMNQLGMTMEGDIVRIATLNTLAQEEKLRQAKYQADQAALDQQKALEPLVTAYLSINYSDAQSEILPHITPILSANRGKASVDKRNNQIIITDTAEKIRQAREIVTIIDKVTPQVIIEARIVEANSAFTRDLGFDWGSVSAGPFNIGDATLTLTGLASNLPATIPSAVVGGTFQKLSGTPFEIIDAQLVASESEGKTNIISAPKVVTLDNKKAMIKQGLEVPYLERDSSGNATVKFKNVDLLLEVTPNITPDDRIVMQIFVTKNDVVDPTADQPALSTNEAETELLVDNGDTIVIGGIVKSTIQYGERGIPGLRHLGVLGWMFKSQSKSDTKNELLIFITPRIVQLERKVKV